MTVGGKTIRILQLMFLGKFTKKHKMFIVGYKANKDLMYLVKLFEAGKLKPVIDQCFPLEETADAFRGKIVITVNQIK